jgi:hypothetical protein
LNEIILMKLSIVFPLGETQMAHVQHYTFTPYEAPAGCGDTVKAVIASVNSKVEAELKRNNGRFNFLNNTREFDVPNERDRYMPPSNPLPLNVNPSTVIDLHVENVVPENVVPENVVPEEYNSPCSIVCMSLLSLVMSIPILYIGYNVENISGRKEWIKGSGFSLVITAAYTPICFCSTKLYSIFLYIDMVLSCILSIWGIVVLFINKGRGYTGIALTIYFVTNGIRSRCQLVSKKRGGIVEEN